MRYKIFIVILLMVSGYACSDDVLVENPPHIMAADNLYVDYAGFEAGINYLYAQFRRERGGQTRGNVNDLLIDPVITGVDNCYGNMETGWATIGDFWGARNNSGETHYRDFWNWCYEIVNAANTILSRAENPDIDWTEEQKNRILGEARHFRAWSYRHLTFMWGDVPLSLEESSGSNIIYDWVRTPVEDVRKQMEADWLFAEQHLPEVQEKDGKISKAVAQHYLAELYLTMGDAAKAKTKAEAAIGNPNFQLTIERYGVKSNQPGTPFTDMFLDGNSNRSEGNLETLWTLQCEYQVIGGGNNIMRRWTKNRYHSGFKPFGFSNTVLFSVENGGRGMGRIGPTRYAMELYDSGDDRGGVHAWRTYAVFNNPNSIPEGFEVGDTLWFKKYEVNDEVYDYSWKGREGKIDDYWWPSTMKWEWANPDDLAGHASYNDLIYLRLADTYLLLAEAQFKLGDAAGAANTINVVRRRANASEITAGDVNMDFILDERSRELWSEEHRRYTLLRNNAWFERIKLYNPIASPNVTERDKLFPIPLSVIDANLTTPMPQNPGY